MHQDSARLRHAPAGERTAGDLEGMGMSGLVDKMIEWRDGVRLEEDFPVSVFLVTILSRELA